MAVRIRCAELFSSRARFLRGLGLVALVWLASATAQSSTLWEWKLGPFYTRSVLWDAAELTEPNLRTLYGQLSRELKDNRAWTVEVFTDKADAGHESAGKMVAETDYDRWLGLTGDRRDVSALSTLAESEGPLPGVDLPISMEAHPFPAPDASAESFSRVQGATSTGLL